MLRRRLRRSLRRVRRRRGARTARHVGRRAGLHADQRDQLPRLGDLRDAPDPSRIAREIDRRRGDERPASATSAGKRSGGSCGPRCCGIDAIRGRGPACALPARRAAHPHRAAAAAPELAWRADEIAELPVAGVGHARRHAPARARRQRRRARSASASTTTTTASGRWAPAGSSGASTIRAASRCRRCCARPRSATGGRSSSPRRATSAAAARAGWPTSPSSSSGRARPACRCSAPASIRRSTGRTGTTPRTGTTAGSGTSPPTPASRPSCSAGSTPATPGACGAPSNDFPTSRSRSDPCHTSSSFPTCAGNSSSSGRSTCSRAWRAHFRVRRSSRSRCTTSGPAWLERTTPCTGVEVLRPHTPIERRRLPRRPARRRCSR